MRYNLDKHVFVRQPGAMPTEVFIKFLSALLPGIVFTGLGALVPISLYFFGGLGLMRPGIKWVCLLSLVTGPLCLFDFLDFIRYRELVIEHLDAKYRHLRRGFRVETF